MKRSWWVSGLLLFLMICLGQCRDGGFAAAQFGPTAADSSSQNT